MLIVQGSWEVLLYEIMFSLSFPLSGNCRDIKHEIKFVFYFHGGIHLTE